MLRREVRLRREYLYRKSLEGAAKADYERRLAIRNALAAGKPIPTELRGAEPRIRDADTYADAAHDAPRSHVDDEYADAGATPPKVVVTTSRDPSSRLAQFAKEVRLLVPNAQRLNRGGLIVPDLMAACRSNGVTDVIVLHETRGEPDALIVCHLPYGPTAYFSLSGVVLRHDVHDATVGTMSLAYPHLVFDGFDTPLGRRVASVLKYLFPVPKEDAARVISFVNRADGVSMRHHTFNAGAAGKGREEDVALKEVGPRMEMSLYQLRLGTLEQKEADDEWVLRPYMNTAKKRDRKSVV